MPRDDGPAPSRRSSRRSSSSDPAAAMAPSPSSSTASLTRPPLPAGPAGPGPEAPPALPPRPQGERGERGERARDARPSPPPAFADPWPPRRGRSPPGAPSSSSSSSSSPPSGTPPPRRRLTSGNIPTASVGYARDPETVVAYFIPLPAPTSQGRQMDVPQRYMLYTPPAAHLLKPTGKEGLRHKARRLAQQEVRKAKTYEGRTLSLRGLHSRALRGVDRAAAALRDADVTFLNRVPRRRVGELVLLHPVAPAGAPAGAPEAAAADAAPTTHAAFAAQLGRARRRAAAHSVASVALFPPAVALDTLAVVVWPFGGLAEVDAVWAWASISGYLTARSVTRRLDPTSMVTTPPPPPPPPPRRESSSPGGQSRRGSKQVRFEDDLDPEDEKLQRRKTRRSPLKVRFVPDEAMATMESYFQEACHRRNPRAFKSPGVPPTQTDVLASIGWWPDRRGRAPGVERDGDWDDENWQTRQAKEDLERVMKKAAKQWDKWCKSYAKYPERAMGEKGHSRASEVMRKLRIKKDMPPTSAKQEEAC